MLRTKKIPHCAVKSKAIETNRIIFESVFFLTIEMCEFFLVFLLTFEDLVRAQTKLTILAEQ